MPLKQVYITESQYQKYLHYCPKGMKWEEFYKQMAGWGLQVLIQTQNEGDE